MKPKSKTNDQMLIELIKSNSPMQNALLRERIIAIMGITVNSINNEPDKWVNMMIHPSLYLELNDNVNDKIGFLLNN
jgi:hypothetical protein